MQYRLSNPAAILTLLLLATGVVYLAGLGGPFLLDDYGSVLPNRPQALDFESLFNAALANRPSLFRRPLANLSFGLNYLLAGTDGMPSPWGYKAVNVAIHLATVVVLFLLARDLFRDDPDIRLRRRATWVALLAAALWALHPLHVSTVLYTVQRMAQLSAFFSLAAALLYFRARRIERNPGCLLLHALAIGVLLLCGMLSKESTAVVPLLFLVVELTVLPSRPSPAVITWRIAFIWAPLLLGFAVFMKVWPSLANNFAGYPFNMEERLISQIPILVGYLQQLLVPLPQRMGLYLDGIAPYQVGLAFWASAGLTVFLISFALIVRRRLPLLSLAILWFYAAHSLESSFLPLELAFEHRNYLPAAGVAMGAASLLASNRRFGVWIAVTLVIVLAVLTTLRAQDWSTRERFVAAQFSHHPQSLRAALDMYSITLSRQDFEQASQVVSRIEGHLPMAAYVMKLLAACRTGSDLKSPPPALGQREIPARLLVPLRAAVRETLNNRCGPQIAPALSQLIDQLLESPRVGWTDTVRLRLMQMRAWLDQANNPDRAAMTYELAAVLFPHEPDPLFQKAYLWLNVGRADRARAELVRLRARASDFAVPIQARLEELAGQIRKLEEMKAKDEQSSHD